MKRIIFVVSVSVLFVSLVGCGRKQQPITEMQEPISIEELGKISVSTQIAQEAAVKAESTETVPAVPSPAVSEPQLAQLPPPGPYKPAVSDIQTALKNAGYYTGLVDGKAGPLTKKAIEDFQMANNLKVDGKVGPKTWALLSAHLVPEPVPPKPQKKR